MKTYVLPFLIMLLSGISNAQQRDLDYYLEQAKTNSPLVNINKNEMFLAELDLKQIRSMLSKPEVNLEASVLFAPIVRRDNNLNRFEWVSAGANDYSGYDLAATDGGQYQTFVSVHQPMFTGSKYRTFANQTDISRQINENNIALTIHELEQIVSYQYILCLKSKVQVEYSLSLLKELEEQLLIMKKLVESAVYKQTDLILLQIEHQNYEIEKKTFEAEYRNSLYDLNLVCGINDTNLVDIQEINFQLKSSPITHSQFLVSYRLDSLNILAGQKVSELKYKPQFSFFVNSGLNAVYQPSFDRIGFSTGITFNWNIFDGNQRKIERVKSTINLKTLEFEKKNFLTQNGIFKNKILNQIHSLNQREHLAEAQITQYDKLLDVYSIELSQGEVSVMDFKNLLKDIVMKKQEILLLKMEKQVIINSYNYWNF
jgi:outer membrane protein TolC